jgi:hypothetical protein
VPTDTKCKLQRTPEDPNCAFKATSGASVTLEIKELDGGGFIDFQAATYGGNAITGTPGKKITFTIIAGQNDLIVVYSFSKPDDGHGELHEVCDQNTFLGTIRATSKTVAYTICA